jgi:hypothetical protein
MFVMENKVAFMVVIIIKLVVIITITTTTIIKEEVKIDSELAERMIAY